jgi:uroporphyrinogen decarboxylase
MFEIPVKKPKPDFDHLVQVLSGYRVPDRIVAAELLIDEEVKRCIIENIFREENVPPPAGQRFGSDGDASIVRRSDDYRKAYRKYHRQLIDFYCRMGYHFIPDLEFYLNFSSLNLVSRVGEDTARLSRGERYWAEEGLGMIRSWEDYERFPWTEARSMLSDYGEHLEYLSKILPDGMKIAAQAALYEPVMEWLLGYEGLFYALHDNPALVEEIFSTYGQLIEESYEIAASVDGVGVIWHGDDLGYKTATLLSPDHLRRFVFPWFKKFAGVARSHGLPFWYHCCGNKDEIMEDLIEDVGIDAIHAFEDSCSPVMSYKERYGDRIGLIGGVDIDKLARLEEEELRNYVRSILDACMPGGRYVFGSGNSICNFIPVSNYLAMLDEAHRWRV